MGLFLLLYPRSPGLRVPDHAGRRRQARAGAEGLFSGQGVRVDAVHSGRRAAFRAGAPGCCGTDHPSRRTLDWSGAARIIGCEGVGRSPDGVGHERLRTVRYPGDAADQPAIAPNDVVTGLLEDLGAWAGLDERRDDGFIGRTGRLLEGGLVNSEERENRQCADDHLQPQRESRSRSLLVRCDPTRLHSVCCRWKPMFITPPSPASPLPAGLRRTRAGRTPRWSGVPVRRTCSGRSGGRPGRCRRRRSGRSGPR